ncbi:MAG TPA: hypothetical protein VFC37_07945 [Terracidiphilus sp.]|nr:hypothetical protein [Terracidiphilus sp.]
MDWPLAPIPHVEEPRQTGEGGLGDLTLNPEPEDGLCCGRPSLRQPEPASLPGSLQALPSVAIPDEGHVRVPGIGRPMLLEIDQKVFPVAGEPVLLKVGQRKREAVVDADEGRNVRPEFGGEPLGYDD